MRNREQHRAVISESLIIERQLAKMGNDRANFHDFSSLVWIFYMKLLTFDM